MIHHWLGSAAGLAVFGFLLRRILRTRTPHPKLPGTGEFDFIIVGGGTAGCVLAARLSERADLRVLLIEAGQRSVLSPARLSTHLVQWQGPL